MSWSEFIPAKAKTILLVIISITVTALLHAVFYRSELGTRLEHVLLDSWFNLRGPIDMQEPVVLISMDEASYQNLELPFNQAWPRRLHAQLLRKLALAKVKRVVFDVLFLGPGQDPDADRELAEALTLVPTVIGVDQDAQDSAFGSSSGLLLPYKPLMESASEVALVGLPEEYGYVRRFQIPDSKSEIAAHFRPLAFAAADFRASSENSGPGERDLINFYGPAAHVPSYSYYQILEEEVPFPLERLKDKVVFVGLHLRSELGPDQKDSFLTSFNKNGRHFGVEIHATAAANLLSQSWIQRLSADRELLILTVLLSIVCFALTLKPVRAGLVLLLIGATWLIISASAFSAFKAHTFIPGLSVILLFGPTLYLGSTLTFYFITRQSQRQLRRAFELYLSPHMARQVSSNPKALGLGGQKVEATAFFTDIANFTTISESMPAEEVTQMLNDYFTEAVDCIFEAQGTLIKFIGDAVFALWGAPVKVENHAEAAVKTALALRKRINEADSLKRYPTLATRIGIHSGPMVVGNLGSRKRFDFTAIGDSVNLASRVEGLNKYFGTSILVTQSIKSALPVSYSLLPMGKVLVVGKSERIEVHTLLDQDPAPAIVELWKSSLEHFQNRAWEQAEQGFIKVKNTTPTLTIAAEFYLKQICEYMRLEPEDDWQGEVVLKSK